MKTFQFDIRNLPAEGKFLCGTQPGSFFALAEDDAVRAVSPLEYELTVVRDGKDIVATGVLAATFELQCGRCLQRFQHRVDMPDYRVELPIENETTMDLTEPVREDMLLTLPNFPRCEDGNVEPRDCPAEGQFDRPPAAAEEPSAAEAGESAGVWGALDQLKP